MNILRNGVVRRAFDLVDCRVAQRSVEWNDRRVTCRYRTAVDLRICCAAYQSARGQNQEGCRCYLKHEATSPIPMFVILVVGARSGSPFGTRVSIPATQPRSEIGGQHD